MQSPRRPTLLAAAVLAAAAAFPALHATPAAAAPVPSQRADDAIDPPGRVGRIADVQGQVWLYHPEDGEWMAAERNRPLTTGDRLATDGDARVEVRIGSTTWRLDGGTEVEVLRLDDERMVLKLHEGSLAVRLRSREQADGFELLTGEGHFTVKRPGRYRFDRRDETSSATVLSGQAYYETQSNALSVYAGQRAEFWIDGSGGPQYSLFEPERDGFSAWVAERDRADDRGASTRYVSPEMTGAEDLDRYGSWQDHPEYGALWVPRVIAPGWAPYTTGRWVWVAPWGWTWVDEAPWGFAPFHYGRWVYVGSSWCWAPGTYVRRPVYAPALVAWIGGANFSIGVSVGSGPAVGWVPLAPREVYVPYYRVSPGYVRNVNVTHVTNITNITTIVNNPQQAVEGRDFRNRKFPHAVTVVPASTFTTRQPVAPVAAQLRDSPAVREIVTRAPRGAVVAAPPVAAPTPAARRPDAPAVRPPVAAPALRERGPAAGFGRDRPDVVRQVPQPSREVERPVAPVARPVPTPGPRPAERRLERPAERTLPPAVRPVQPPASPQMQPQRPERPERFERPERPERIERPEPVTRLQPPPQAIQPMQPQPAPAFRAQPPVVQAPQAAPPAQRGFGNGQGAGPALRERPDLGNHGRGPRQEP